MQTTDYTENLRQHGIATTQRGTGAPPAPIPPPVLPPIVPPPVTGAHPAVTPNSTGTLAPPAKKRRKGGKRRSKEELARDRAKVPYATVLYAAVRLEGGNHREVAARFGLKSTQFSHYLCGDDEIPPDLLVAFSDAYPEVAKEVWRRAQLEIDPDPAAPEPLVEEPKEVLTTAEMPEVKADGARERQLQAVQAIGRVTVLLPYPKDPALLEEWARAVRAIIVDQHGAGIFGF